MQTMPLPDGEVVVLPQQGGDQSPLYALDVLGVSVSVYVTENGTRTVHVGTLDANSPPVGTTTTVEVNNSGATDIE